MIFFCLFVTGCGRKQHTIFQFDDQLNLKISKLAFPSVQKVEAKFVVGGTKISWKPILNSVITINKKKYPIKLCGYYVYRLTDGYFIPKKPLTKKLTTEVFFIDTQKQKTKKKQSYVVRPVFFVNKQIVIGLSSAIVCI